jgi:hypothetical protein
MIQIRVWGVGKHGHVDSEFCTAQTSSADGLDDDSMYIVYTRQGPGHGTQVWCGKHSLHLTASGFLPPLFQLDGHFPG